MLCAVVAYYALTARLSDCAIRWPRFDACFIAALNYIKTVGTPAQTTKHEAQHETVSEMTASAATMISLNPASTRKAPTVTASLYASPEVEGGAGQPTSLADKYHQHNKSLIVKLKLDREAVAETTQVTPFVEVVERQDGATGFDDDEYDGGIDYGDDSVIGEDADSVIGDTIDDVIVTANRFDMGDNGRAFHCPTTSKKRKLERLAKYSDGNELAEVDGHGWRQASRSQRYKGQSDYLL
jgi:hypothetical protein